MHSISKEDQLHMIREHMAKLSTYIVDDLCPEVHDVEDFTQEEMEKLEQFTDEHPSFTVWVSQLYEILGISDELKSAVIN